MKIKSIVVLKPIPINGIDEPMPQKSKIIFDGSYPIKNREHKVVFQIGESFGTVGDRCYSITQEELLKLEKDGIAILYYWGHRKNKSLIK
jgi:hypothetical protein